MQELVLEAPASAFIVNEKYLNAMPRPSYDEKRALEQKIIQRGQLEPIKVNRKMVILDGHTRYDILSQRGMMIKYTFMDFATEEEEFIYVVESNVFRRHLTQFQILESLFEFYKAEKLARQTIDISESSYKVLQCVKDGKTTSTDIAEVTKLNVTTVKNILKSLTDEWFVSRNEAYVEYGKGKGGTHLFKYTMMPKGEEKLITYTKKKIGSVDMMFGKITGINRNTVNSGMWLIEHADKQTKELLRLGKMGIETAYKMLSDKNHRTTWNERGEYWKSYDLIICPHCNHTSPKSEYKRAPRSKP